jgi:hypothetical protein
MANDARNAPRGNRLLILAAVVLASAGVAELSQADGSSGPPRPAANVLGKLPPTTGSGAPGAAAKHAAPAPLPYSVPTHIAIPAVNLAADVIVVDLDDDGSIATP